MKHFWQIFVMCIFWVITLWMMAPCLDLEPELVPQEKPMYLVPRCDNCPWVKFRKCDCPAGTLNYSCCHHSVGECNCFDTYYKEMMGILRRAKESMMSVPWCSDMNPASELGRVWKKLFKLIPRASVSHFDLYCGTCSLMGNSKILWASNLGKNINQHTSVCRRSQTLIQGLELAGNQTRGHFTYYRGVRGQGSWRQLVMLLLLFCGLVWTLNTLDFGKWCPSLVEWKLAKTRYDLGNRLDNHGSHTGLHGILQTHQMPQAFSHCSICQEYPIVSWGILSFQCDGEHLVDALFWALFLMLFL